MSMAVDSKTQVFFDTPKVVYADEDYSVKPPAYSTIDALIQSLEKNGPLVTLAKVGPGAYSEAPFKLTEQENNQDIYGFKPTAAKTHTVAIPAILLGAKKAGDKSYVYYALAQDITRDNESLIRGYEPKETKIYVMSYDNFLKRALVDLHPVCPHSDFLYTTGADALLLNSETRAKCKELGQQIFDQYKAAAKGNSDAGKDALFRICTAARVLTKDGMTRAAHIERAWDGVGDETCLWQS